MSFVFGISMQKSLSGLNEFPCSHNYASRETYCLSCPPSKLIQAFTNAPVTPYHGGWWARIHCINSLLFSPTASDASSEHSAGSQSTGAESISFRNTLLAGGSRSTRKAAIPSSSLSGMMGKIGEQLGTMNTDFLHPEDLWKQPNKGCAACFVVVMLLTYLIQGWGWRERVGVICIF